MLFRSAIDCLVVSPGIAPGDAEVVRAKEAGMTVVGEMQLGVSRFKGKIIAVTGSKGKSSLVKFIADALALAGVKAIPCGNYGLAMCEVAAINPQPEVAVLECSSFQLEYGAMEPAPVAAVLLNVQADHLDRHGTMENYLAAKMNVFGNMKEDALKIKNREIENREISESAGLWQGSYFDNDVLRAAAVAAVKVLRFWGIDDGKIKEAFEKFEPLPHRMRKVAETDGVVFVDDSKATSLTAMAAGVRMSEKPVFLIAGGRLKENISVNGNYLLEIGAKKAYLIGECAEQMADAWRGSLPTEICGEMGKAVSSAFRDAADAGGGTVLLSPGTASFDQYKNFEERGDAFAQEAAKSKKTILKTTNGATPK